MIDPPFAIEELKMSWRRVKWDLDHRVFTTHAFEKDLLDLGEDEWLPQLREELKTGRYTPQPCEIVEEVKAGFHIRPGARLAMSDQVVYAAVVQRLYQVVWDYLRVRKGTKDFAYLLRGAEKVPWFQQPAFSAWKAFQKVSLKRLESGAESVLFADISGYYENIDLSRLRDILRGVGVPDDVLNLLFKCLWAWAQPRGRGIPQGLSSSDLLAKAYLEPTDRQLERDGFDHIRYVDDYRVFCNGRLVAKKALRKLTALLRHYGLNVGTPKTQILDAGAARQKIEGNIPNIERLADELLEALRAQGFQNPYLRADVFPDLQPDQADVAREVVEDAFREYFSDSNAPFDASLFHYLLNKLGQAHSDVALGFSLRQLPDRPEETSYVLRYFAHFLDDHDVADQVLAYAGSDNAIYEHQLFLIMKWLDKNQVQIDGCLELARRIMADRSRPLWLRSYAMAILGTFGDNADLDSIEAMYASASNDLERCTILCAIRRMPINQRNAMYARCKDQSFLNSLAVRWARENF